MFAAAECELVFPFIRSASLLTKCGRSVIHYRALKWLQQDQNAARSKAYVQFLLMFDGKCPSGTRGSSIITLEILILLTSMVVLASQFLISQ